MYGEQGYLARVFVVQRLRLRRRRNVRLRLPSSSSVHKWLVMRSKSSSDVHSELQCVSLSLFFSQYTGEDYEMIASVFRLVARILSRSGMQLAAHARPPGCLLLRMGRGSP